MHFLLSISVSSLVMNCMKSIQKSYFNIIFLCQLQTPYFLPTNWALVSSHLGQARRCANWFLSRRPSRKMLGLPHYSLPVCQEIAFYSNSRPCNLHPEICGGFPIESKLVAGPCPLEGPGQVRAPLTGRWCLKQLPSCKASSRPILHYLFAPSWLIVTSSVLI